jgi:O-antigen biosynthesis protein
VTIQILNWDGKHLLAECLPRLLKAVSKAGGRHKILVVDNGSTDNSLDFLRKEFPAVGVVALDRNYGFSIGNNLGLKHVVTDIVVLLNNDMLVDDDFLLPLLVPFSENNVFAVTSQISFADATKRREETGKTRGRFEGGIFYLWHDEMNADDENRSAAPVFWAGGGSCAIDRRKYEMLGGFDSLYHPFYVEDVDLSYQAWKRGWKSLLAPASHVVHKHRGTSRPKYGDEFVDNTIRRNHYLLVWKNVTDFRLLLEHLFQLPRIHGRGILRHGPAFEVRAFLRALSRLPLAAIRRFANLHAYTLSDRDVLKFAR